MTAIITMIAIVAVIAIISVIAIANRCLPSVVDAKGKENN